MKTKNNDDRRLHVCFRFLIKIFTFAGNMPTMGYKSYRNFTNNYVNSSNIDRAAALYHHNAANNNINSNNNNINTNNNNNNTSNGYRKMQPSYQRYQNVAWCSYGKGKSSNNGINWRNECRHTFDYDDDLDLNIGLSPPSESMILQRRIMRRSDISIRSPPPAPQTASG